MKYLFDVSEPEGCVKRKSKRPAATPPPPDDSDASASKYSPPSQGVDAAVGTIDDGTYVCSHPRCGAGAQDILEVEGKEWMIACAFCGAMQWVKAIAGHLKPKAEEFRFRDGRFAGLTTAETWLEPRGPDYLEWAASSHKRDTVRQAARNYLDSFRAVR